MAAWWLILLTLVWSALPTVEALARVEAAAARAVALQADPASSPSHPSAERLDEPGVSTIAPERGGGDAPARPIALTPSLGGPAPAFALVSFTSTPRQGAFVAVEWLAGLHPARAPPARW